MQIKSVARWDDIIVEDDLAKGAPLENIKHTPLMALTLKFWVTLTLKVSACTLKYTGWPRIGVWMVHSFLRSQLPCRWDDQSMACSHDPWQVAWGWLGLQEGGEKMSLRKKIQKWPCDFCPAIEVITFSIDNGVQVIAEWMGNSIAHEHTSNPLTMFLLTLLSLPQWRWIQNTLGHFLNLLPWLCSSTIAWSLGVEDVALVTGLAQRLWFFLLMWIASSKLKLSWEVRKLPNELKMGGPLT